MPLFNQLPAPFALFDGDLDSVNGTGVGVANTAYLVGCFLTASAILTSIRVHFGTGGTGHYDVGIYSDNNGVPGSLLANAAATATSLATASGFKTTSLLNGNLPLVPGRYWLALWIDNATDTIGKSTTSVGEVIVQAGTTAGPLPALASSLTGLANSAFKPFIVGLLQGGWS